MLHYKWGWFVKQKGTQIDNETWAQSITYS